MYARPEDCASLMAGRSGAEWLWRMIYSSMQGRYCSRPKKRQSQVNRHSLARQVEVWGVELENGQRVTVGSEAQAVAFARQAGSRPTRIARRESSLISGTPEQVKARLDALQAEEQLDELIIDTPISDGPARLHSLRLLAQAHYGKEVLNVL